MKPIKVFLLNSFTDIESGGNGAGVVFGEGFNEEEMIAITRQVGYSETAFVDRVCDDEFNIRYFTPAGEVDLCGHATIAVFVCLKNEKLINKRKYKVNTKAGVVNVVVDDDIVTMSQVLPLYCEIIEKEEFLPCFKNLKLEDFMPDVPLQVVSTGLRDIIVPVSRLKTLMKLEPCFDEIKKISKKYNTIGAHLFSFETFNNSTACTRNFAPLYDVSEESATGTSNGALSCYLFKYFNGLCGLDFNKLVFEQGYNMKRPSEIFARLKIENNEIKAVFVGGRAVCTGCLEICV